MKFERVWAMPSSATFTIKPIADLLREVVKDDSIWIDPFAGFNSPAQITNDLNPASPAMCHEDALLFLRGFTDDSVYGVLFDPPYSPRQLSECYRSVGKAVTQETTRASFWGDIKAEIARVVVVGGQVVTCGWNSGGIGKQYNFDLTRILLVPHGGWHNDTIVTVETKIR
jgi:hypothetical protein